MMPQEVILLAQTWTKALLMCAPCICVLHEVRGYLYTPPVVTGFPGILLYALRSCNLGC